MKWQLSSKPQKNCRQISWRKEVGQQILWVVASGIHIKFLQSREHRHTPYVTMKWRKEPLHKTDDLYKDCQHSCGFSSLFIQKERYYCTNLGQNWLWQGHRFLALWEIGSRPQRSSPRGRKVSSTSHLLLIPTLALTLPNSSSEVNNWPFRLLLNFPSQLPVFT